jgi:hypothetical protein
VREGELDRGEQGAVGVGGGRGSWVEGREGQLNGGREGELGREGVGRGWWW